MSAWVRPWFDHGSVPAAPTLLQVVAHALLLQDLLGYQALSAGVWYVAIDLQLFALTVLALPGAQQAQRRWPMLPVQLGMALLLLMGTASMLVFNRQDGLDSTALYFVGSYTLGMSAFWVSNGLRSGRDAAIDGSWSRTGGPGVPAMAAVGGLALVVAFGLVALGAAAQRQASGTPRVHGFWQTAVTRSGLVRVGQMAYSIFLINFPVCLLINAVVSRWWSGQLLANVLGLLAAFTLSLFAGGVLYRNVEIRQSPRCAHPVRA